MQSRIKPDANMMVVLSLMVGNDMFTRVLPYHDVSQYMGAAATQLAQRLDMLVKSHELALGLQGSQQKEKQCKWSKSKYVDIARQHC